MNASNTLKIMKALADSSRLSIMKSLMDKPQYVEELSERLNLASSTVSFHLKKLENARLIRKSKEQYYVIFSPNVEIFNSTLRELISYENKDKLTQDERINRYKSRVIDTYFQKGRLIKIPTQHKKRWIILEKIANELADNKIYGEKELNIKISEFYEDYCTIRRYLVDEGILSRDKGEYRKNPDVLNSDDRSDNSGGVHGLKKSFLDSIKNI